MFLASRPPGSIDGKSKAALADVPANVYRLRLKDLPPEIWAAAGADYHSLEFDLLAMTIEKQGISGDGGLSRHVG